jgi:hypothetical protein
VQFEELTTLEATELEQLGTVYGVIFLFKYPTGETRGEKPKDGTYDHEAANNLFFAAQTIQNACGTQAIVSLLLNREKEVNIGKELKEFKEFAGEFPPEVQLHKYALAGRVANRTYSYAAKPYQTQTSFAKPTTPSPAPRPSSTKHNAQPPKTTMFITSSRKPSHMHSLRIHSTNSIPQLHVNKQHTLRTRRPPTRPHLPWRLHPLAIPEQDHSRPATPHRALP